MTNKIQKIILIILLTSFFDTNAQTRYLEETFDNVTIESDVIYANNISILPALAGLPPAATDLACDIYHPTGDTITNRPVIIIAHTGSFLPPVINGQATGNKNDSSLVEQCVRWAKKGYVAVAFNNRLGWNPTSTDQNTRTSTLIQASYRGIQDARSMIRFMRHSQANGNPYRIDGSKIVMGGQGTGGYLSLGVATLDTSAKLFLPKFLDLSDPANPVPYVIPQVFGNIWGTDMGYIPVTDSAGNSVVDSTGNPIMAPFSLPNHVGYSSEISLAFNMGGALADISWLDAGDVPIVSFHCNNDPYAPIDTGDIIVPSTGDFVVEAMGSRTVQYYSNLYGNNDIFVQAGFTDNFTNAANNNNSGYEGFYNFITPAPSSTPNAFGEIEEEQASPWDWWDNITYGIQAEAVNGIAGLTSPAFFEANAILGNPNMSPNNGKTYIDTIQGYLAPRIYLVLGLATSTSLHEIIDASTKIYPNPATNNLNVINYASNISEISIINLNGDEVLNSLVNNQQKKINISQLAKGIYIIDIKTDKTSIKRKLVIK